MKMDQEEFAALPSNVQELMNLREHVTEMRTKKNMIVDKLAEPPLHHPACDDPKGRFDWYVVIDDAGQVQGYFHTPKGVEL
jgi:hypothetical protein